MIGVRFFCLPRSIFSRPVAQDLFLKVIILATLGCHGFDFVLAAKSSTEFHTLKQTGSEFGPEMVLRSNTLATSWTLPSVTNTPPGRYWLGDSLMEANGLIYITCGLFRDTTNFRGLLSDLHSYDPATATWSPITAIGVSVAARRRHATASWENKLYIHGGVTTVATGGKLFTGCT
jgi:hypothetical protein